MKQIVLVVVAAALAAGPCTTALAAQDSAATAVPLDARQQQVRDRLTELKTRLRLTPEQDAKVGPIMRDQMDQMRAVRDKYEGQTSRRARIGMVRELKRIQEDGDSRLGDILDPGQMEELKKMRAEMRADLRARRSR